MSKQNPKPEEKPKIIIEFDKDPILAEIGFDTMIGDYKRISWKADEWLGKKATAKKTIFDAVEGVSADTVLYNGFSSTIVRPETGQRVDPDLLKENLMKIGKLNALQVVEIFSKSLVPGKPKTPYVRITGPKGALPKSKKDGEED